MKSKLYIISAMILATWLPSAAQDVKFSVEVSTDTLLLGNYFELKFSIENASSNTFDPPDLTGVNVIGGPNTSTQMSIINGVMSQNAAYTYYIEPDDIGVVTIPPAYLDVEGKTLETPPIDIIVVPNPDGIIQNPHQPAIRYDRQLEQVEKDSVKSKRPLRKI